MLIGVPRETKNSEHRVALTPSGVHELTRLGHEVLVQRGAGVGSSIPDADLVAAGARIAATAEEVWGAAELLLKVKEPVGPEHALLRRGQVVFTYLHLAADRAGTQALLDSGATAIAYETVQLPDGSLPLLAPMSEVAGRLAPQAGAHHLLRAGGGRGVLLSGVPGVRPASVVVIGAGVSGRAAARIAVGLGAEVTVLDLSLPRLREVDDHFGGRVRTVVSNALELDRAVTGADLVVGAVLVPGARAPKLVTDDAISRMRPGSVLVDIAIDQGGCFESSRPTTHDDPTFVVHESVFYCVANMPGAVPHTSTYALTNSTLPYVVALAERGWRGAVSGADALGTSLAAGLSTHDGALLSPAVADAHGMTATDPAVVLA